MRQTLLGAELVKNKDHGCSAYQHIHVIPEENKKLRNTVASSGLKNKGNSMSYVWKNVLKGKDTYLCLSPKELLKSCYLQQDTSSFLSYLERRYGI